MGKREGAWVLYCFILDIVQSQTWVLPEEMRQGMCWGMGDWAEQKHLQPCIGQGGVSAVLTVIFMGLMFSEGNR